MHKRRGGKASGQSILKGWGQAHLRMLEGCWTRSQDRWRTKRINLLIESSCTITWTREVPALQVWGQAWLGVHLKEVGVHLIRAQQVLCHPWEHRMPPREWTQHQGHGIQFLMLIFISVFIDWSLHVHCIRMYIGAFILFCSHTKLWKYSRPNMGTSLSPSPIVGRSFRVKRSSRSNMSPSKRMEGR